MIGLLCAYACRAARQAPLTFTVQTETVLRRDADRFFGIDLNYIRDRDSNRPQARPLDDALADIGVRWLRFPGGEKSNYHLWSEPPFTAPAPKSLGWYATPAGDRMDFDEFVRHARKLRAEPYVVVGYVPKEKAGLTEAEWIESAAAWVRYSRQKQYGVRYWEIGNENWNEHKGQPAELARIVVEFAKAMKAEDPTIRVGASGNTMAWWKDFLPAASGSLDFISVSQYTGWEWGSYDAFLKNPPLIHSADDALAAIKTYASPADRDRLEVIVPETNTTDYSKGGWHDANDLGHALVTFATLGHLAMQPKVRAAMVWTTRWMNDTEAHSTETYALGPRNELTPTGEALKAWARYAQPCLLQVDGGDSTTEAFAAKSSDGKHLTLWLLNRGNRPREVRVPVRGYRIALAIRFKGASPTDTSPSWDTVSMHPNSEPSGTLPSFCLTILLLTAK